MYLFTRRTRLSGGNGTAGVEWAAGVCAKVRELTGQQVDLWANVYSPGFGTISWTAWFADLASLESVADQLQADQGYLEMTNKGASLTEGGLDDGLVQLVHGAPDPGRAVNYVGGVQAVCAAGNIGRAMGLGVEIAQHAEKITGLPTMFGRGMTGPYAGVGWLTGYENLAQFEASQDALAGDDAWLKMVDSTEGAFVDDPASLQATIYRKLA